VCITDHKQYIGRISIYYTCNCFSVYVPCMFSVFYLLVCCWYYYYQGRPIIINNALNTVTLRRKHRRDTLNHGVHHALNIPGLT